MGAVGGPLEFSRRISWYGSPSSRSNYYITELNQGGYYCSIYHSHLSTSFMFLLMVFTSDFQYQFCNETSLYIYKQTDEFFTLIVNVCHEEMEEFIDET